MGNEKNDENAVSWAPEVQTDSSGHWYGNALRFATREEAERNVANLYLRWTSVRETRVVASLDAVNYRWDTENGLVAVATATESTVAA